MDPQPLALIVFLPVAVALLLLCTGRGLPARLWQSLGLVATLVTLGCALPLWVHYDLVDGGYQFIERAPWIETFGIHYFVGIDGISLTLVLLTAFVAPIVLLASWNSAGENARSYVFFVLLLETCLLGAFVSLNLFLFFVFSELVLLPLCFLIGVSGGPLRVYAVTRLLLVTLLGSSSMFVALLVLSGLHAEHSGGAIGFDWIALPGSAGLGLLDTPVPTAGTDEWWRTQPFLFGAFALSYAIRMPLVPFHTWFPAAQSEAPAGAAALLAGVVLKLGSYGFLRFAFPLFPDAVADASGLLFAVLAVGMLHAALVGLAQADLSRLVAYLSVVQLGLIGLGILALDSQGISGSVLQMVNHGISTVALLLLLGFLYERRRSLRIEDLGGVARPMPLFAVFYGFVMMSLIGLPVLNGFVGEFLILLGTFSVSPWAAVGAAAALAIIAAGMLRVYGRVMLGPVDNPENRGLIDLGIRERVLLLALLVPIVTLGVYPDPVLRRIEPAAIRTLRQVEARTVRTETGLVSSRFVSPLAWPNSWREIGDPIAQHPGVGRSR